jgi:hypothetical protein
MPDLPAASVFEKRGRRPLFEKLTLMLDLSRGGVYTLEQLKGAARLARAAGFTGIGLYTEYFEVEGWPEVQALVAETGQLRAAEIAEVAGYARGLGLEVMPFIETFGHLEHILGLPAFERYRLAGSRSTLDPRAEGVYEAFIEPLVAAAAAPYRAAGAPLRMNVGGDEVARGIPPGLLVSHLNRVADLCERQGAAPQIWGDKLAELPDAVLAGLSGRITVAYWNYDETDAAVVRGHLETLQSRGVRLAAATTSVMAHNLLYPFCDWALRNIEAVVTAAAGQGVGECLLSVWHDDNAEAPFLTMIPTLVACGAMAHGCSSGEVEDVVQEVCGDPLSLFVLLAQVNYRDRGAARIQAATLIHNLLKVLVFENPAEARYTGRFATRLTPYYASLAAELERLKETVHPANRLAATYAWALADYVSVKAELGKELHAAAEVMAPAALLEAFGPRAILAIEKLSFLWMLHRKLWLAEKKPQGWAKLDYRYRKAAAQLAALHADLERSAREERLPDYLLRQGYPAVHLPLDRLWYNQL